jgi:hypothetical protein
MRWHRDIVYVMTYKWTTLHNVLKFHVLFLDKYY